MCSGKFNHQYVMNLKHVRVYGKTLMSSVNVNYIIAKRINRVMLMLSTGLRWSGVSEATSMGGREM